MSGTVPEVSSVALLRNTTSGTASGTTTGQFPALRTDFGGVFRFQGCVTVTRSRGELLRGPGSNGEILVGYRLTSACKAFGVRELITAATVRTVLPGTSRRGDQRGRHRPRIRNRSAISVVLPAGTTGTPKGQASWPLAPASAAPAP